jgi:hypothetical protein
MTNPAANSSLGADLLGRFPLGRPVLVSRVLRFEREDRSGWMIGSAEGGSRGTPDRQEKCSAGVLPIRAPGQLSRGGLQPLGESHGNRGRLLDERGHDADPAAD